MDQTPTPQSLSAAAPDAAAPDPAVPDSASIGRPSPGYSVRNLSPINWVGLATLIEKEIRRFIKVGMQTVLAPMITSLLFLTIFGLALGGVVRNTGGVPFLVFLAPGLVAMSMLQNAFANTSSSITVAKVQGNIVDVLMPPLSYLELAIAFVVGGVARGVVVGAATVVAIALVHVLTPMTLFTTMPPGGLFFILFHAVFGSMLLSFIGLAAGIWADKFDHIGAITTFVVTPLTFLSGTFYSLDRLPDAMRAVTQFNPFFYVIDGFRYGFIGAVDATHPPKVWLGVAIVLAANAALGWLCVRMLASGYKLKA